MIEYELPFGKGVQRVKLPEEHILYDIHGTTGYVEANLANATKVALWQSIWLIFYKKQRKLLCGAG